MARPCKRFHDTIDPACPFCAAAVRSPKVRVKWGCEEEFSSVNFGEISRSLAGTKSHRSKAIPLPIVDCPHRGVIIERCTSCGGAGDVYQCDHFDEGVILKPSRKAKPGVRNCQECPENQSSRVVK
jgi:hypothetical protein